MFDDEQESGHLSSLPKKIQQGHSSKKFSKSTFQQYGQKKENRGGKTQRREDRKREGQRRESAKRKKIQVREKVEKSRCTVFVIQ